MNTQTFSLPLVITEIRTALYAYYEHHEKLHVLLGKFSADLVQNLPDPATKSPSGPVPLPPTIEIELKHCLARIHFSNARFADALQKLSNLLET